MTVLQELVAALDAAAEELGRSSDAHKRAWAAHFASDLKSVKLMAFREPAEVV